MSADDCMYIDGLNSRVKKLEAKLQAMDARLEHAINDKIETEEKLKVAVLDIGWLTRRFTDSDCDEIDLIREKHGLEKIKAK